MEATKRSAVAREWLWGTTAWGGGAQLRGLEQLAQTREESGGDWGTGPRRGRQHCGEEMNMKEEEVGSPKWGTGGWS
jgi:hypothetical protein